MPLTQKFLRFNKRLYFLRSVQFLEFKNSNIYHEALLLTCRMQLPLTLGERPTNVLRASVRVGCVRVCRLILLFLYNLQLPKLPDKKTKLSDPAQKIDLASLSGC